jgi:interferon-stimulated exonuclease-like 2
MSTILLNLDFGQPSKKAFGGNAKHQRFVKKRRFLEQKGFLNKKNQPPNKVSKLNSEPPKKGETSRVDGILKILPCPKKKEAAASKRDSEQSKDKKAPLSWLTPAPSKKTASVVSKIDLLGEFQSALPKTKSTQKKGSKKKSLKKKIATENSTQAQSKDKGSKKKPLKKNAVPNSTQARSEDKCPTVPQNLPGKMVAIDCEMVGTGPKGRVSSLARCSIVNYNGDVLYDEYVLPPCYIVNYRTRWSGIRKCHMVNATPFKTARSQVRSVGRDSRERSGEDFQQVIFWGGVKGW